MTPEDLRNGIFALRTRRLGTVAELMVQRLNKLQPAKDQFHDLYDDLAEHRVEVKFSTVQRKHEVVLNADNVLKGIEDALTSERAVRFEQYTETQFDCNIQQVKRAEFEVLYYGLFFFDKVLIFRIESDKIDSKVGYSDKQHKGNVGEGQFHITQKNLGYHLKHHKFAELDYDELLKLLTAAA